MERCKGDHEAVAFRKEHSKRFDCLRTPEFIQQIWENVMEVQDEGMRALAQEMALMRTSVISRTRVAKINFLQKRLKKTG